MENSVERTTYLPSPPDHELLTVQNMLIHGQFPNKYLLMHECMAYLNSCSNMSFKWRSAVASGKCVTRAWEIWWLENRFWSHSERST